MCGCRQFDGRSDSRGFSTDLAMVPLFAVGEIFLIGAFQLLHGTNIRPEREKRRKDQKQTEKHSFIQHLSFTSICQIQLFYMIQSSVTEHGEDVPGSLIKLKLALTAAAINQKQSQLFISCINTHEVISTGRSQKKQQKVDSKLHFCWFHERVRS